MLQSTWFAENERTTATAIGILANSLGSNIGFFAPLFVKTAAQIPRLLYSQWILAMVTLILTVVYFPNKPPVPPSPAAELMDGGATLTVASLWTETKRAMSTRSFAIVALFGGGLAGL